jgi:shikimate kinase
MLADFMKRCSLARMDKDISTQIEFIKSKLAQTGQSIVFVGLMGAGKTRLGEALAQALGFGFNDSDDLIVERHGVISDVFVTQGEGAFRKMESEAIADLIAGTPKVLSTGGGAFMKEPTRALIQRNALSIWLNADLGTLYNRVKDTKHRPLLETGADKRVILQGFIDARYPTYALADVEAVISDEGTSSKEESIAQNCDRVINAVYKHLTR